MSKLFPRSANKLPLQIIVYLVVLAGIATAGVTYYMTPKYHARRVTRRFSRCHSATRSTSRNRTRLPLLPLERRQVGSLECADGADVHELPQYHQGKQPAARPGARKFRKQHRRCRGCGFTTRRISRTSITPVHVNRGVSCVECHGKVNEMDASRTCSR